jgi:tRNA G10  N-methylase Trm11
VGPGHPAKFSQVILDVIGVWLARSGRGLVLDPFAGTGRIHQVADAIGARSVGIELEREWAAMHPRTIQGNAKALPFRAGTFDAVATSPVYGNRMSDHHHARDASKRNTYTHTLGRQLHPDNAGRMHWSPGRRGAAYRDLHASAWAEAVRVLKTGGVFILNVSDFLIRGERQHVCNWHLANLANLGLVVVDHISVPTQRQRHGANGAQRVESEQVYLLRRGHHDR